VRAPRKTRRVDYPVELAELRRELGLAATEISRRCPGIAAAAIRRWESGVQPLPEQVERVREVLQRAYRASGGEDRWLASSASRHAGRVSRVRMVS